MVGSPRRKARPAARFSHRDYRIGDVPRLGRAPLLVSDNAQLIPFPAEPQHGLDKICTMDPEDPGHPQQQMRRVCCHNRRIACGLGGAVDIDRCQRLVFPMWPNAGSGIHVVGRQVNDGQAARRRSPGDNPGALGIYRICGLSIALGAIDSGVSCTINDGRQPGRRQRARDRGRICYVAGRSIASQTLRASPFNQRASDLPTGAKDQQRHAASVGANTPRRSCL
jgi:hypothetical protein